MKLTPTFPRFLTIKEDADQLVEAFVDYLEQRLLARLAEARPKPLGLATGRTMLPIYNTLVTRFKSWPKKYFEKLLNNWCSFNLDEYLGLPVGDQRSFSMYMNKNLVEPLCLNPDLLHIPNVNARSPEVEAQSYLARLESLGGIGVQLLGLGVNGHVGFNEPPCDSNASCRTVFLSDSTRFQNAFSFENDFKKVPSRAITLGLREILLADEIHLIVIGMEKAKVLKSILESPCSNLLPASWLKLHSNVSLWADTAAYSKCI